MTANWTGEGVSGRGAREGNVGKYNQNTSLDMCENILIKLVITYN